MLSSIVSRRPPSARRRTPQGQYPLTRNILLYFITDYASSLCVDFTSCPPYLVVIVSRLSIVRRDLGAVGDDLGSERYTTKWRRPQRGWRHLQPAVWEWTEKVRRSHVFLNVLDKRCVVLFLLHARSRTIHNGVLCFIPSVKRTSCLSEGVSVTVPSLCY